MEIERLDPAASTNDLDALFAIHARAEQADSPEKPPLTRRQFHGWWTYGQGGEPLESWVARVDGAAHVVGGYNLVFFDTDNTHLAVFKPVIDPAERRRGYGTELLEHATGRVRAAGRRLIVVETAEGSPGAAFAAAAGFERGLDEPRRVLDLERVDTAAQAGLLEQAWEAAQGYSLLRWAGLLPGEHLDNVAALRQQMSDAPVDDLEYGDEAWDSQRIRAAERGNELRGEREYTLVARHDASGDLVALTAVAVAEGQPEWAHQEDTVVLPAHRGHRLGLVLKLSMLAWLAGQEPHLRKIITGNAASNAHMLRINELLGFELQRNYSDWQLRV